MKLEIIRNGEVIEILDLNTRHIHTQCENIEEAIKWIAVNVNGGTVVFDRITNRKFCTFDAIPIMLKSTILVDGEHWEIPYQKLLRATPVRKIINNIETNVYKASELIEHKANQMITCAGKMYQHYVGNIYQSII